MRGQRLVILGVSVLGLGVMFDCDGPDAKTKTEAVKPADTKPADTKPADTKTADTKLADTKLEAPEPTEPAVDPAPTEPAADPTPVPDAPPSEAAPPPGTPPTGPVLIDGELSLRPEHIGDLHLRMTAAEVIAKLGKPKVKSKIEEEGATGDFVQTWEYVAEGLEVGMRAATAKGAQTIAYLRAGPTCTLPASWGLEIGSTRAEVEKVYGTAFDPDFTDADQFTAGSIYGGVMFEMKDGKVASIFIGAGAE